MTITYDDLKFRPDYWSPANPLAAIVANIKGQRRREMIQDIVTGDAAQRAERLGRDDNEVELMRKADPDLYADELDDPGRLGVIDPSFLGGEFLPAYRASEVEIARIVLDSVTCDVVSIRARRVEQGIAYGVADEYDNEFEWEPASSSKPLTLGELIALIDSITDDYCDGGQSWIAAVRTGQVDAGLTPEEAATFVHVTSPFYPKLEEHYEADAKKWLAEARKAQSE